MNSWCDEVEDGAANQIQNVFEHPLVEGRVAIMPDCHTGYGVPIGCVLAAKNGVIPNAVGVDIGCGVIAVKSDLLIDEIPIEDIKEVMDMVRDVVPLGMKHRDKPVAKRDMPELPTLETNVCHMEYESARHQLGTLGGGNHFIEFQKDEKGFVWFMIHTGSRNVGYKVANYYNGLAEDLNKMWLHHNLVKQELAFLPQGCEAFGLYSREMKYCIDFAKKNRNLIAYEVVQCMRKVFPEVTFTESYEVPHNYAQIESHGGVNYFIHRKGAIRVRKGEFGIIPGSQGSSSFIVLGLGNAEAYESCSHGAGRVMSRSKARKELSLKEEQKILDTMEVIHSVRNECDLDEAPSAYKDINDVMEQQRDLVETVHRLFPVGVIKG